MSPSELSSIKWENDGEMSAHDTWTLVKKLTKVESKTKHQTCCICRRNTATPSAPVAAEFDPFLWNAVWSLMETWVRLFVLTPPFEGGRRSEYSLI